MIKDHPIAGIFPLLAMAELNELALDIKCNGQQVPIILHEGKILDGRNRYRACEIAGVKPRMETYQGETPASYVISMNARRRHLTPNQAAASAVEAMPWLEKEAKERQVSAGKQFHRGSKKVSQKIDQALPNEGKAAAHAATLFHTNRQYVADAKRIKEQAPDQFEAIKRGDATIADVKREIKKQEHRAKVKEMASAPKPKRIDGPFDLILADPPWRYEHCEADNREVENHYQTATLEDIFSHFQAANPCEKSDCILFLWATAPKLEEAMRVMNAWGFSYRSCAVWDKGKIGMGYWWRIQHELLLVGVKGSPGVTPECERTSSIIHRSTPSIRTRGEQGDMFLAQESALACPYECAAKTRGRTMAKPDRHRAEQTWAERKEMDG